MGVIDGAAGLALDGARSLAVRAARIGQTLLATDGRDVLVNDPDGWEVDQPWLWWTGPAGGGGTGGPFGNPIPNSGGPWEALTRIPAVGRSTSLIVDTLAGLPWRVLRGDETLPSPDWLADPQGLRLDGRVINPGSVGSARWSRVDFWAQWLTSALWFGDGYVWVPSRTADGSPKPPLYVLSPRHVTIEGGRYFVETPETERTELDASEVIHLRGLEPIKGGHGSGVLTRYVYSLNEGAAVRTYADSVFRAGVPAGYLKTTQPHLSQEQADNLKAAWMTAHGTASRSIAVLNATTDFTPLTYKPVDADLVAMLRWSLLDISLAFGVPPFMLGAPTDANTYANVESRMIELSRFTLQPWAVRTEAVLDAQFPRGTSVKIALDALMRADTSTRFAAYKTALDSGWLTVDEVRALEDRPPLPDSEPEPEPVLVPNEVPA